MEKEFKFTIPNENDDYIYTACKIKNCYVVTIDDKTNLYFLERNVREYLDEGSWVKIDDENNQ